MKEKHNYPDFPHCYITVPNSIAKLSYLVLSVSLSVLSDNPLFQIMVFCSAVFYMNNNSEKFASSTFRAENQHSSADTNLQHHPAYIILPLFHTSHFNTKDEGNVLFRLYCYLLITIQNVTIQKTTPCKLSTVKSPRTLQFMLLVPVDDTYKNIKE